MSENRLNPIVPNGFADHSPCEKWLFHWGIHHFQTNPFTIIQPFFFARNLLPGPAEVDASGRPAAVGSLVRCLFLPFFGWDFRFSTAEVHEHFRAEIVNPEEAILNDSDDSRVETD